MKLEITFCREDLFEHKKNVDIKDITLYDFPRLTRELKAEAYIIRFIADVGGLMMTKTFIDRGHHEVYID